MQWLRTKTMRDGFNQIAEKSSQSIVDEMVAINFPGQEHLTPRVEMKAGVLSAMHSQKIFDQEAVERISDDMERHYWVVGVNNTDHLLYTSDHPVVRRANQMRDGRRLVGIRDPGIEFTFPLDSRHILLILERTHFAEWRKYDNRAIQITTAQVADYNGLQVMRSSQRVFCAEDDFDVAREVCAAHPEVRDPNRPRILVETTPIAPAGIGQDGKEELKNYMIVTALE